jgi:hypothetical protein
LVAFRAENDLQQGDSFVMCKSMIISFSSGFPSTAQGKVQVVDRFYFSDTHVRVCWIRNDPVLKTDSPTARNRLDNAAPSSRFYCQV